MEVPTSLAALLPSVDGVLTFLSENPILRGMQMALLGGAALLVFLVFFATRDILRRTHAFLSQLGCILLVAALPGIGFLLYLLVRPATTLHERETLQTLQKLQTKMQELEASMQKGQSTQQMPYRPLICGECHRTIASLRGFSARMKKGETKQPTWTAREVATAPSLISQPQP